MFFQFQNKKEQTVLMDCLFFVSALPIFPGRYQPSIVGADELNCRVRDGNGWALIAISTDFVDTGSVSLTSPYLLFLADPLAPGFARKLF